MGTCKMTLQFGQRTLLPAYSGLTLSDFPQVQLIGMSMKLAPKSVMASEEDDVF